MCLIIIFSFTMNQSLFYGRITHPGVVYHFCIFNDCLFPSRRPSVRKTCSRTSPPFGTVHHMKEKIGVILFQLYVSGFWHFMYVLVFKRLAFSWDWNSCNTLNFWTDSDRSMEYHFDLYKCVNLWIYDLLAFRDRWISGLWTWGLPALIVWINIMNPMVERLRTSNDSQ